VHRSRGRACMVQKQAAIPEAAVAEVSCPTNRAPASPSWHGHALTRAYPALHTSPALPLAQPGLALQVFLARWHETPVAVKVLTSAGIDVGKSL